MKKYSRWSGLAALAAAHATACAHHGRSAEDGGARPSAAFEATARPALEPTWRTQGPDSPSWRFDRSGLDDGQQEDRQPPVEGALMDFVARALHRSPALAAAHARWRGAVARSDASGRLPSPELSYGGFIRAVETRVGPQRHRISLRQSFPWPGRLAAASDAASQQAEVEAETFRARVLEVVHEVAAAYWRLWRLERTHTIRLDHERLLERLIDTVQARVETGEKSFAELLQVQLRLRMLQDHRILHRSQRRQAEVQLLAAMGEAPSRGLRTAAAPPPVRRPKLAPGQLLALLRAHPELRRWSRIEAAQQAQVRVARSEGRPDFTVGADYIVTGDARTPGVDDSGKDPIGLSLGLRLPVWSRAGRAADAAEASAAAARAEAQGAWLGASAELESILARLEESADRVGRYEDTLIPQAEALEASINAAYEVQRATVASVLLALEDELELRLELANARAAHATAWAELERLVGRPLNSSAGDQP